MRVRSAAHLVVMLLTIAFLSGGSAHAGPVALYSGDPLATCAVDTFGSNAPGTQVEPSLAAHGSPAGPSAANLVAVWQQDRWSNGGARGIVAGTSFDNGQTWAVAPLPFKKCVDPAMNYSRATDPWVSIGVDGRVYLVGLAFTLVHGTDPNSETLASGAIVAVTSDTGGRTWSAPSIIRDSMHVDKVSVTADPRPPQTAYTVWQEPAVAYFSKTVDGGRSWSIPRVIVAGTFGKTFTNGNQILVDPRRGTLFDFFDYGKKGGSTRTVCAVHAGGSHCH